MKSLLGFFLVIIFYINLFDSAPLNIDSGNVKTRSKRSLYYRNDDEGMYLDKVHRQKLAKNPVFSPSILSNMFQVHTGVSHDSGMYKNQRYLKRDGYKNDDNYYNDFVDHDDDDDDDDEYNQRNYRKSAKNRKAKYENQRMGPQIDFKPRKKTIHKKPVYGSKNLRTKNDFDEEHEKVNDVNDDDDEDDYSEDDDGEEILKSDLKKENKEERDKDYDKEKAHKLAFNKNQHQNMKFFRVNPLRKNEMVHKLSYKNEPPIKGLISIDINTNSIRRNVAENKKYKDLDNIVSISIY